MIKRLHLLTTGVVILMGANIINDLAGRPFFPITKMIYLSWEGTVATWYSSFLLAIGAYLSYLCYLKGKELFIERSHAFLLFSSLLLLMSVDEVAQLHETFGAKLGEILLGINVQQGVGIAKSTAWAWGGGALVIIVFICAFLYIHKPIIKVPKTAILLSAGLFAIVFGGVVLEASTNFLNNQELQWVFDIEVIVEETLEMLGTMLILYAHAVWLDGIKSSDDMENHNL